MNANEIQSWLIKHIADLLDVPEDSLNIHEPFASYGLSSRDAVSLSGELQELLGRSLPATLAYEYPTIELLSMHLSNFGFSKSTAKKLPVKHIPTSEPIAVVGLACRFPESQNPNSFWQLLSNGVDAISEVPVDRWDSDGVFHPDPSTPGKSVSRWGGFIEGIDQFDPFFFGISPIEAKQMDPQQRLLLELSYEALEDAGQSQTEIRGTNTGVFIGVSINEYSIQQFKDPLSITSHSGTGSALSIAANRLSYFYDLNGPSLAIDTACSSSVASVHLACESIKRGECQMAIAGGVNLILSPAHSIAFTKAGVLAPDGRCKTFDAQANGYVRGEGGGLLVLKPLSAAVADNDKIYACINGSAMNQDGRSNGLMAPSRAAQEEMLHAAYQNAGVSTESVQYIEAHGTGTLLGDQIEAMALGSVIGSNRKNGPCKIGSVKTNIGHLEAAAGIAGLIKVILSLKHKMIPPSLHFNSPNPDLSLEELNLQVADQLTEWPSLGKTTYAGVSSFGFGGTNVHVVLSGVDSLEYRTQHSQNTSDPENDYILPLSAKTEESLESLVESYTLLLANNANPADVCYSTSVKRNHLGHRLVAFGNSSEELREGLQSFIKKETHPNLLVGNVIPNTKQKIIFIFPGQGGQWLGMGRELLMLEPLFQETLEHCDHLIKQDFGWSLIELLLSDEPSWINDIGFVQPVLFSIQVALAELWKSWDIRPDAVIGHSMGEIAAAHLAGILSLEDGIKIICTRSNLLRKSQGKGGMMITALSKEQAEVSIMKHGRNLSIAALNSPNSTVLAGDVKSINEMMEELESQNLFCQLISVDIASHHPQMDQYRQELLIELGGLKPKSEKIQMYSTVTGTNVKNLVFNADYWADNLIKPVLFSEVTQRLMETGNTTFIEIGPHPVLLGSIQQTAGEGKYLTKVIPSMIRNEIEQQSLYKSLGLLYLDGFDVSWQNLYHSPRNFIDLPIYPWQHQRYWIDKNQTSSILLDHNSVHPLLGSKINLAHAPHTFVWQANIDTRLQTYLNDHQVEGVVVLPASVYIEIVLKAASESGITNTHELSNFSFIERMALMPNENQKIQIALTPLENGNFSFNVYHDYDKNSSWKVLASANFIKNSIQIREPSTVEFEDIVENNEVFITGEKLYQNLLSRGLQYGPNFQLVESIWWQDNMVLGQINCDDFSRFDGANYIIHPTVLDACLQIIGVIGNSGDEDLYLPVGCESIRFFQNGETLKWSLVKLSNDWAASKDLVNADVQLFDSDGQMVAELISFQLQRIKKRKLPSFIQSEISMYQTRWDVIEGSHVCSNENRKNRNWLILSDDIGYGASLAEQFLANGDDCRLVNVKEITPNSLKTSDEDMLKFLDNILDEFTSQLDGIIHLWSLDIPPIIDGEYDTNSMRLMSNISVMQLIKALVKRPEISPHLWLVSKGSQPVFQNDKICVEQSSLWGIGKVISFELPELRCVRIDLDINQVPHDSASLLFTQINNQDLEDQIAFRDNKRYALRILPYSITSASEIMIKPLKSDKTYLITGGLGGLGLKVAQWMVNGGVRHLVLLGRAKPSDRQMEEVKKLQNEGAEVVLFEVDISDAGQVKKVFNNISRDMPALLGVVHAAGVLDDGALVNMDSGKFEKVLRPKVEGTLNLHTETLGQKLDFFCLFSSAVSVLGSPGQGNYATASSFLDAFAHYRRNQGLPAISINWGPWAEVGLAAEATERLKEENSSSDHLIKVIKPDQGMKILELLLDEPVAQVSVLPFNLENLLELYPPASEMPFFEHARNSTTYFSRLYARPNLQQDYVAPDNEIEQKLVDLWQQTLHIDRVGVNDSFFELGGDSVLGAQLITSIQKTFGIRIDLQDAFKVFTIASIAKMIEVALIQKIDQMSESEVQEELKTK